MTAVAAAATDDFVIVEIFVDELAGGMVRVRAPMVHFVLPSVISCENRTVRAAKAHALKVIALQMEIPDRIRFVVIRKTKDKE